MTSSPRQSLLASTLLARGYHIRCGFDADDPGDDAAHDMIAVHPTVKRLRSPAHDWNDALASAFQASRCLVPLVAPRYYHPSQHHMLGTKGSLGPSSRGSLNLNPIGEGAYEPRC
jgi:hypothetical protein